MVFVRNIINRFWQFPRHTFCKELYARPFGATKNYLSVFVIVFLLLSYAFKHNLKPKIIFV